MADDSKRGRYPEATELVTRMMRAYSIDPDEEGAVASLARTTGIESRYLYRWFNGEYRPSLGNAIDMLQRAGLLQANAPRARDGSAPRPLTSDDLLRHHDAIDDRLRNIEAMLSELTRSMAVGSVPRRRGS